MGTCMGTCKVTCIGTCMDLVLAWFWPGSAEPRRAEASLGGCWEEGHGEVLGGSWEGPGRVLGGH